MNVGYIGLDHHHRDPYLETLQQLPVEVTAACEPDPEFDTDGIELLADVPIFDTVDEVLDSDVDAVWVTLSNRSTPAVVVKALEQDVHVYTEKPVGRTAADLEPVMAAEAESSAVTCVSYPWRGHPFADALRERTREGFFGAVRSVEARFVASELSHRDTSHYLFDAGESRGGILQWLGIHWLDLVPWTLSERIVTVTADTVSSTAGVDVEDGATLQFELDNGALCTLVTGYYLDDGCYDTEILIRGSDGTARWDPIGRTFGFNDETELELTDLTGRWDEPSRTVTHQYDVRPGYGGNWGYEYAAQFLAACRGEATVPASLRDAHRVLEVLDAAYESARTGRTVSVDADAASLSE